MTTERLDPSPPADAAPSSVSPSSVASQSPPSVSPPSVAPPSVAPPSVAPPSSVAPQPSAPPSARSAPPGAPASGYPVAPPPPVRRIVVGPATSASRRSLLPTPVVLPGAPLSASGEGEGAGTISEHEAAQIATVYARLDRTDHYTLMGVAATADVKEIKRAYYALAKLHHPDRFFRRDVGALGPKIEAIFRALTAALETLCDAERRAAYDVYLRDLLKSRITRRSAEALEASGDYRAASVVWTRVVAALPADAYSHHRLAYALLRARTELSSAIEAVARAIALDPTRAEYRLTAASLYLASGLERKALAELEVACELEVDRADIAGLHAAVAARCSRV